MGRWTVATKRSEKKWQREKTIMQKTIEKARKPTAARKQTRTLFLDKPSK